MGIKQLLTGLAVLIKDSKCVWIFESLSLLGQIGVRYSPMPFPLQKKAMPIKRLLANLKRCLHCNYLKFLLLRIVYHEQLL